MSRSALARLTRKSAAAAVVFAALGDPTRLALVVQLSDGSRQSIAQLCDGHALTRQAISKHLRVLEDAGLVASLRAGRQSLFALNPRSLDEIRSYIAQVSDQWDASLSRLKSFVEQ